MEIAKLVLEYVKALVWPLTVCALSLFFRSEIKRVLARLRKAVLPGGVSVDLHRAMHGRFVSREEAEEVIKAAEVLFGQYLAWLSWGFDDNWRPTRP